MDEATERELIEEETARLVAAGAPTAIAREVATVRVTADGPIACDETVDKDGRLVGLAGWEWDETGRILADPHSEARAALKRWGRPA